MLNPVTHLIRDKLKWRTRSSPRQNKTTDCRKRCQTAVVWGWIHRDLEAVEQLVGGAGEGQFCGNWEARGILRDQRGGSIYNAWKEGS